MQRNICNVPAIDLLSLLHEKYPNTEFFLVRIFLHSVQIQENTDQKNFRIWTFLTQHMLCVKDSPTLYKTRVAEFLKASGRVSKSLKPKTNQEQEEVKVLSN